MQMPPGTSSELPDSVIINYEEPAPKSPPLLSVGPIAWVRKNLFGSSLDIFLTFFGAALTVLVLVMFIDWAIRGANWFSVTANFRQYMLGAFPIAQEWRIVAIVLLTVFTLGIALAAWTRRVPRTLFLGLGLLTVAVIVLPTILVAIFPGEPMFVAAGNVAIQSGSVSETPQDIAAFIARGGAEMTFTHSPFEDDEALAALNGFADRSTNALRNAAGDRLNAIARIEEDTRRLEEHAAEIASGQELGTLTPSQLANIERDLASLDPSDPVTEIYGTNAISVEMTIYDHEMQTIAGPFILGPGTDPVTVTYPESNWYVMRKVVVAGEGATPISVMGLSPVYASREFQQVTDLFGLLADDYPVPRIDNEPLPYLTLIDNQYRGQVSLDSYFGTYVAPFLARHRWNFLLIMAVFFVGWAVGEALDRAFPPAPRKRSLSGRLSFWLLIILPIIFFVAITGAGPLTEVDPDLWGGLLLAFVLTVFGIVLSFPLGVLLALGRRSSLPLVKYTSTLTIELVRGSPFIVVLFMTQLMLPFVNPAFAAVPNTIRALAATVIFSAAYLAENVRGGLQSIPPGQEEAARAVGLRTWQVTVFITLPQALRAVIPALVGQFISLFKDTSLVAIVGLIDLVGVVRAVVVQAEFLGTRREGLLFISLIYFLFSYVMAYVSRRIEATGSGAARRM
jgi:His/Glu/Gln/Arg/opine family amino acid ABC transporter permease subunit